MTRRHGPLPPLALTLLLSLSLAGCLRGQAAPPSESLALHVGRTASTARPARSCSTRAPPTFAAGHLPDATNVPNDMIPRLSGELPKDKAAPIFAYGHSGRRAGLASRTLADMGYVHVVRPEGGGFPDWAQAG